SLRSEGGPAALSQADRAADHGAHRSGTGFEILASAEMALRGRLCPGVDASSPFRGDFVLEQAGPVGKGAPPEGSRGPHNGGPGNPPAAATAADRCRNETHRASV